MSLPTSNENITKTILFPVPTDWMGDTQDDDEVGVTTYTGPRYWLTYWEPGENNSMIEFFPIGDKDCGRVPVAGSVQVVLDVEEYPLHAAALFGYGRIPAPEQITVNCGPSSDPNPTISDPYHFNEVFDMTTFYYDTETSAWSSPQFSRDTPDCCFPDEETVCFGWRNIRHTRNKMLEMADGEGTNPNTPDLNAEWEAYRQKLRDLPADWADVGDATHLICWPEMPARVSERTSDLGGGNGDPDIEGRFDLGHGLGF